MESIYPPGYFLASEHINIKDYFKKFKGALDQVDVFLNQPSVSQSNNEKTVDNQIDFSRAFDIAGVEWTEKEKQCLVECCDVKNLDVDGEEEQIDIKGLTMTKIITLYKPFKSKGADNLKTIEAVNSRTISFQSKFKHNTTFDMDLFPPATGDNCDLEPGNNIIVYVNIYVPFKYTYGEVFKGRHLRFFKSIAILGTNTLADLRDVINCPSDLAVCKEVSENPDFSQNYPLGKELYPSGFFFIDGVFYNDLRNTAAIDYSAVIRKWAEEKKIGNFRTSEMDKTLIESLSPRVGYPYLYQHKGCCEHIVTFTHMRLLNSNDCLNSQNYPYYSGIGKLRDRQCIICGSNSASWLIVDCDRLPQSKAALCTYCFKSYNYIDGRKIGNFKAYPYYNNTAVL